MSEKTCLNCKYASWNKTAAGRLHPSGDGRCEWEFPEIQIPACCYYISGRDTAPRPFGGFISRKNPRKSCKTWEQK